MNRLALFPYFITAMKRIYTLLACTLLFAGCQTPESHNPSGIAEIPIPPPTTLSLDDLIAECDTIRLEAPDEALFGSIDQIRFMNGKMYVSNAEAVFIYTPEGKYLGKISNQGQGPEEYIRITCFEPDVCNNRLLLTDNFSRRLFVYDEMGALQRVISLDFPPFYITSDRSGRFIHLNSAVTDEFTDKEMRENNVHIVDSCGNVVETFLPDDTPNRLGFSNLSPTNLTEDGELLYLPIFSDTIYRIHGSQAVPEYILRNETGCKSLTKADKQGIYYLGERGNLEEYENNGYFLPEGTLLYSDSLVVITSYAKGRLFTYYSKKYNKSVTIRTDKVKGHEGLRALFMRRPMAVHNGWLYYGSYDDIAGYLLSTSLPEGKIRTFFENRTPDDNPWIIRYRLNEEIFTDK